METDILIQLDLPLWSTPSRMHKVRDQVKYAVEMANAAGLAAACNAEQDNRQGRIKISLQVELDELTMRLIQYLRTEGWERTGNGVAWIVTLPPELFPSGSYAAASAYAHAFKETLRQEMHPEPLRFKVECKYRVTQ